MALEIIRKTQPDILLTDIVMPNLDGLELIAQTRRLYPFIQILVLRNCHNDYKYVRLALKQGADDYILKASMKPEDLLLQLLEIEKELDADGVRAAHNKAASPDASEALRRLLANESGSSGIMGGNLALSCTNLPIKALAAVKIHSFDALRLNSANSGKTLLDFLNQELARQMPLRRLLNCPGEIALLMDGSDRLVLESFLEQCIAFTQNILG